MSTVSTRGQTEFQWKFTPQEVEPATSEKFLPTSHQLLPLDPREFNVFIRLYINYTLIILNLITERIDVVRLVQIYFTCQLHRSKRELN